MSSQRKSNNAFYVNGIKIYTYKKIAEFWFAEKYIDVKRNDANRTFTVIVRENTEQQKIKRFLEFWQGLEIVVVGGVAFESDNSEEQNKKNVEQKIVEQNQQEQIEQILRGQPKKGNFFS